MGPAKGVREQATAAKRAAGGGIKETKKGKGSGNAVPLCRHKGGKSVH
jgi:hypothetical protein